MRLAARGRRLFQQPRLHRVVDEVVDDAAVERALERRLVDVRKHADRSRVHEQIPALRRHWKRCRRSRRQARATSFAFAAIPAVHRHDAARRRERHSDRARRSAGAQNRRARAAQIESAAQRREKSADVGVAGLPAQRVAPIGVDGADFSAEVVDVVGTLETDRPCTES